MQQTLVHFLNHGVLPFVGRAEQVARIEGFWRQTAESFGLRSLLLLGEAGVGKSRLVEEVIPRISLAGGAVIHAKLYPDSTTSVAPLFARALGRSIVAQSLLKGEPEETIAGVSAALRRICGLRPTLLVIEDIHLLEGDALREFAGLLDRLGDEPLSVLCAARPVELAARATLERFLVDEIELEGLNAGQIAELCHQVLGQEVGAPLAAMLEEKTCGNALALRSALRGALKPGGATGRDRDAAPVWGRVDRGNLVESLERNVRLLSEGMAAHLNEEEKRAAERIASLGEIFARETAMEILSSMQKDDSEHAERLLSQLLFKGVITTAISTSNPLDARRSLHPPLSFTHSLLHRHFVEHGDVDGSVLTGVVSRDLPLYSMTLFERLATVRHVPSSGAEPERSVVIRALDIGAHLRGTVDWKLEEIVLKAARAIVDACGGEWSPEERLLLHVRVSEAEGYLSMPSLSLLQRRDYYQALYDLLADAPYESLRVHELAALCQLYWWESHHRFEPGIDPGATMVRLQQIRDLVGRHPALKFTKVHVNHIREKAITTSRGEKSQTAAEVEAEFREILDAPGIDEEFRRYAIIKVMPRFLYRYQTPEELDERIRMLAELEAMIEPDDDLNRDELAVPRLTFLINILKFDEALERVEEALARTLLTSHSIRALPFREMQMYVTLMIDGDLETARARAAAIEKDSPKPTPLAFTNQLAFLLNYFALLAHDDAAVTRTVELFPIDPDGLSAAFRHYMGLAQGELRAATELLDQDNSHEKTIRDLALLAMGEDVPNREEIIASAIKRLDDPIFRIDLVHYHSHILRMLRMLPESDDRSKGGSGVAAAIAKGARQQFDFLEDRALPVLMAPLIERYGEFLSKSELASWKTRQAAVARRRGSHSGAHEDDQPKIRVSMFGAIAIQRPGQEPERVKGAQLCTLLGLMVADRLQDKPLSQREFMAIVIGSERDPDSARKSLNFAVFRLRELLGNPLAIETGGETPRLSEELVAVDFIEASESLARAARELSDGGLMRAVPELLESLARSAGQVAYPTLYEEFFEAGREDYESTLRRVVIGVSRSLIREGDHASAEEVLLRAYKAMSDDEELGELLQRVLVQQGKRAHAARISLRVAEEA